MFDLFSFLNRMFGGSREDTRSAARDRLRLVLVSDRATVAPHLMESLRNELIEVISRYMEIDTRTMQMGLERHEGAMALAANIPVRSVHRSSAEMAAVRPDTPPPAPRPRTERARTAILDAPEPSVELEASLETSIEASMEGDGSRLTPRRRSRKSRRRTSRAD